MYYTMYICYNDIVLLDQEGVLWLVDTNGNVDSILVLLPTVKGDIVNLTVSVAVLESDSSVVTRVWTQISKCC